MWEKQLSSSLFLLQYWVVNTFKVSNWPSVKKYHHSRLVFFFFFLEGFKVGHFSMLARNHLSCWLPKYLHLVPVGVQRISCCKPVPILASPMSNSSFKFCIFYLFIFAKANFYVLIWDASRKNVQGQAKQIGIFSAKRKIWITTKILDKELVSKPMLWCLLPYINISYNIFIYIRN